MTMPRDQAGTEMTEAWRTYLSALEKSMKSLEEDIDQAACMAVSCTDEWCTATEHYLDDLASALFSIHEPRMTSDEDSRRLKHMKLRVHELYAKYRAVPKK